jgi:DUF4097 and DUF4098 domain-containing protein YvlB
MLTPVLIAALTMASPQAADTIIPVDRDTRLEVSNFRGEVVVDSWDRDAVRVVADFEGGQVLDASQAGTSLRVRPRNRGGGPREADFRITIPRWMAVRVEGNQVDVEIRGAGGEVSVETVAGDVDVEGGRDQISLRSIQGEISLRGARGRVEAVSVNEEITLTDIEGELYVETTNGDVTLEGIRSSWVRATTVNGDMMYNGTIRDDGRYAFSTHNGDLEVTVPEGANVTVAVSTFQGEFESEFPVRLTGTTQDRRFNFTLGTGRAQLELESFNGEITLRRPQ